MRFAARTPAQAAQKYQAAGVQYRKDLRRASIIATDRASRDAAKAVQSRIRSVGLGRLAGAVGQTSTARLGDKPGKLPYGVIFARGGDDSLAAGALESYSQGATITAKNKRWLAFATSAVPRFVSISGRRFRTTPELYNASSLATSIGKLIFKPIGPNRAVLVIRKANVSVKTGRAKAPGKRRSRSAVLTKDVVAFVLIRVTRRAQRFDKDKEIRPFAQAMPKYIQQALDEIEGRRS